MKGKLCTGFGVGQELGCIVNRWRWSGWKNITQSKTFAKQCDFYNRRL